MMKLRKNLKFASFVVFISSYMGSSFIIWALSLFSFERSRKFLVKNISFHSNVALKLFGIKLIKKDIEGINPENYLLVSNHVSYIDILIISSVFPSCFVTSVEMKETPFLGQICSLGGCLFVERRSRHGLSDEVKNLTKALSKNLNVVIFPESKSTNGEEVIRFRRPLFQAAIDSNKKILPLCLNYKKIDKDEVTIKNRDLVFWYGDMSFFGHLLKILESKKIEVELTKLDPIEITGAMTKEELAEIAHTKIKTTYKPIIA